MWCYANRENMELQDKFAQHYNNTADWFNKIKFHEFSKRTRLSIVLNEKSNLNIFFMYYA